MKNVLEVIDKVTKFIIGEVEDVKDEKQKVFGFTPVVRKKRKYTKRKNK